MVAKEKDDIIIESSNHEDLKILLDTSYPLLKKFRETCPGSYKHSQAVVSIIEGVSIALDLDVVFMKVAALYHDIGKIFDSKYFTENQLDDEDPHKELDSKISAQIISRHVPDGINILINNKDFPRKIIEIISQHHGDSVIKYFFNKSGSKDENSFKYKCTKPQCVESAVLMVCDYIEATSRSLIQSGKYKPDEIIDDTINGLLDDGQLDEVYMRLGDLKKIKDALASELAGTYQKRVDYDKAEEEAVEGGLGV